MKIKSSTVATCLFLAAMCCDTSLALAEGNTKDNKEFGLDIKNKQNNTSHADQNTTNFNLRSKTSKKKNVSKNFKKFYIYGPENKPTIDLSNKNSLIKTYSQASSILQKTKNGKKTDRQKFLDAWNALSSKEKKSKDMTNINNSYKKILSVTTAAKSVLKFYEDVKSNKDDLIKNPSKANKLNSKSNKTLGARGKAYDDYKKATKVESTSKSKRMAYINEKYLDSVYFLNVSKYIKEKNKDKATKEMSKIKDKTLKASAKDAIEKNFLSSKQEKVIYNFKKFYSHGPVSNPTIDLTKKDHIIKKYSQAESLLKTTKGSTIYDRQLFLNSYNSLSSSEKKHPEIKETKAKYDNIVIILEAAESTLKFYESVKENAEELILNPIESKSLNSKSNLQLGARGKAYNDYVKATNIESKKSSKRVAYLYEKYCDTINFLNIPKYIEAGNSEYALEIADKIVDSSLRKIAINAIFDAQDSNFEITPDSPTFKYNMMNRPSYHEKTKHYYLIRSYLEELDKRGGGTLTLNKGVYNISNLLYVPSNTTIILNGATIKKTGYSGDSSLASTKSVFQVIAPSKISNNETVGEYNGEANIKFIGKNNATIDLNSLKESIGIILGHNSDVEISGINFKNMNGGHFIELDASKNVKIHSNSFVGSVAYGSLNKEAINLDTPDKLTGGWNCDWSKYDNTPNLNVVIENNKFSNLDRAIGTHKYSGGIYHTDIYIRNNNIEKTRSDSIRIMNWKNVVIENNTIKDIVSDKTSARGILASGVINPTIKNNTFMNMPRTMQFCPGKNDGPGSEYEITYNELSLENKNDLVNNTLIDVEEDFIRINSEYDVFTNPEKLYFFN